MAGYGITLSFYSPRPPFSRRVLQIKVPSDGGATPPSSACAGLSAGTCASALSVTGSRCGSLLSRPTRTSRTLTTATVTAISGLRPYSSYLSISLSRSITLSLCLCVSPEVTVTSLHPPRLCRLAVFSIQPTLLSISTSHYCVALKSS